MGVSFLMLAAQVVFTAHPDFRFGYLDVDQYRRLSLWMLNQRANELSQTVDPIERDKLCFANSALARKADKIIPPNARVFVDGVLGEEGAGRSAMYLFLQYYLYPRDLEISMEGRATMNGNIFLGTRWPGGPEVLEAAGYDFLVGVVSPESIGLKPLTPMKR